MPPVVPHDLVSLTPNFLPIPSSNSVSVLNASDDGRPRKKFKLCNSSPDKETSTGNLDLVNCDEQSFRKVVHDSCSSVTESQIKSSFPRFFIPNKEGNSEVKCDKKLKLRNWLKEKAFGWGKSKKTKQNDSVKPEPKSIIKVAEISDAFSKHTLQMQEGNLQFKNCGPRSPRLRPRSYKYVFHFNNSGHLEYMFTLDL